jgi:hypothetical protein
VAIIYPSRRVVTYVYGADKDRPVAVHGGRGIGTVVSGIRYEPYGAPKSWRWVGDPNKTHVVFRDLLARPREIRESFNGSFLSRVLYSRYDGDGDLGLENDASPAKTWLVRGTSGNRTRTYEYETKKDVARSWVDDGVPEALLFDGGGRRRVEKAGTASFVYEFSATANERLLASTRRRACRPLRTRARSASGTT